MELSMRFIIQLLEKKFEEEKKDFETKFHKLNGMETKIFESSYWRGIRAILIIIKKGNLK